MPNETITPSAELEVWDHAQSPLYDRYNTQSEYKYRTGLIVLPVAADDEAPVVIRVHGPYRERTERFDVKKNSAPPVIPAPKDSGPFKFISGTIIVPQRVQNQTLSLFDWQVVGEYTLIDQETVGDANETAGLVLTMNPWVYATQEENSQQYGGVAEAAISLGANLLEGALATLGAAVESGYDVGVGIAQAAEYDQTNPYSVYSTPSYLPPLYNETLIMGGPRPGS